MVRIKSPVGGTTLFFLSAILPILALIGLVAIDLQNDLNRFTLTKSAANKEITRSLKSSLDKFFADRNRHASDALGRTERIKSQSINLYSPFSSFFGKEAKEDLVKVVSQGRMVPLDVALTVNLGGFSLKDQAFVRDNIKLLWGYLDNQPGISFELGLASEDSIERLTSKSYQANVGWATRESKRNSIINSISNEPPPWAQGTAKFLSVGYELLYAEPRASHANRLMIFLSPLNLFSENDQALLSAIMGSGFCSTRSLGTTIAHLSLSDTNQLRLLENDVECENMRFVSMSVPNTSESLYLNLANIVRSSLQVEIVR